jgi:hypothetical protein
MAGHISPFAFYHDAEQFLEEPATILPRNSEILDCSDLASAMGFQLMTPERTRTIDSAALLLKRTCLLTPYLSKDPG